MPGEMSRTTTHIHRYLLIYFTWAGLLTLYVDVRLMIFFMNVLFTLPNLTMQFFSGCHFEEKGQILNFVPKEGLMKKSPDSKIWYRDKWAMCPKDVLGKSPKLCGGNPKLTFCLKKAPLPRMKSHGFTEIDQSVALLIWGMLHLTTFLSPCNHCRYLHIYKNANIYHNKYARLYICANICF